MTSSMEKCFLFPCLILLATSSIVQSQFNTGATVNECQSLEPAGFTPLTEDVPFFVVVPSTSYTPGNTVTVFIASLVTVNVRGLVIQARRADGTDTTPVGSFTLPNNDNNLYRFLTCGSSTTGTVTNTDDTPKTLTLSFEWTAPAVNVGNVNFFVSLADTNGNFWSRITQQTPLPPNPNILSIAPCPTPIIQENSQASWTSPNCLRGNSVLPNSATCAPPSGSTFQPGNTEVTCTCQSPGETASCSFTVTITTVINNPPDTPTCPGPQTAIAPMGSNSVSVQYSPVQCNDIEDGGFLANCLPPSGFQFGIETTAVFCSCTDSGGLVSSCSFTVTVIDGRDPCVPNPCSAGNECRLSTSSLAGYTCHSVVGTPCL